MITEPLRFSRHLTLRLFPIVCLLLIPDHALAQGAGIPRNWVVSSDGKIMYEGVGFDNDGEGWMKKAAQIIEKVRSPQ